MAQAYEIRYFKGAELSEAVADAAPAWMFVKANDGTLVLFLKQGEVCPEVLMEAWAAYREMEMPLAQIPQQGRRRPWITRRTILGAGLLAASCAEGAALLARVGGTPGIVA